MLTLRSFLSFFFLLFLIPCFNPSQHRRRRRRRTGLKASFFSIIKHLFSSSSPSPSSAASNPQPLPPPSHSSSARSFRLNPSLFPDIHPCSACGEVFRSPSLLDHHRSIHHPISDLHDDDDDANIVRIIFRTGWPSAATPQIHRILKIHNTAKTVARFEDYRERVKSRAASNTARRDHGRCIADGNELLRFHCTTFVCGLDSGGGVCGRQYCSLCGIIARGFWRKMEGISTMPTSHAAHVSTEAELEFMDVKRAVLVCRVIAGRVGCDPDTGFDSLAGRDDHEILVFNPRAVLPCFVILYTI